MRFATVISSDYSHSPDLAPLPHATAIGAEVVQRLASDDLGCTVVSLDGDRDLPENLERTLERIPESVESLLFYFRGYMACVGDRPPALVLDAPRLRTFPLARLGALLGRYTERALLFLDLSAITDPHQDQDDAAEAALQALDDGGGRVGAMIGAHTLLGLGGESPRFTTLLLRSLDWLSALQRQDPVTAEELYQLVLYGQVKLHPSETTRFLAPHRELILLPSRGWSIPPPAQVTQDWQSVLEAAEAFTTPCFGPPIPSSPIISIEPQPAPVSLPAHVLVPEPAPASEPEPVTASEHEPVLVPKSVPVFASEPAPVFALAPEPASALVPESAPEPEPVPVPVSAPVSASELAPVSALAPEPASALVPEAAPEPEPEPVPMPVPVSAPVSASEPASESALEPEPVAESAPAASEPAPVSASESAPAAEPAPVSASEFAPAPRSEPELPPLSRPSPSARSWPVPPPVTAHPTAPPPSSPVSQKPVAILSVPPSPHTVEGCLALGDSCAAKEELEAALEHYKRALFVLGTVKTPQRAHLYVKVGDVTRRLGRGQSALNNYDKALTIDPLNLQALFWATEMLCESKDYGRVEEFQRRRLQAVTDEHSRVEVLEGIVKLWLDHAKDLTKAQAALVELLKERPEDAPTWEKLVQVLDAQALISEAIAARRSLANVLQDQPPRRSETLLRAAGLARDQLNDLDLAIELAEQALSAHPGEPLALEFLARTLAVAKRWEALASVMEQVLELRLGDPSAVEIAKQLAILCRHYLGDLDRAARGLELSVSSDTSDVELRNQLITLHRDRRDLPAALIHCRAAIHLEPTQAVHYRKAYEIFEGLGNKDLAWNAASILDHLGEADINESLFATTYRPESLPQVQSPLEDQHWRSGLFYPERDHALARVLEIIAPATQAYRLEVLEKDRKLFQGDPSHLEDPEKSTTMLARALSWSARVLGVPLPRLYLSPSVEQELTTIPAAVPTILASRALGSGLGLPELAFLWGRQLADFRPEHALLAFFPKLEELEPWVTATFLAFDLIRLEPKEAHRDAHKLASRLARKLGEEMRLKLQEAADSLSFSSFDSQLRQWARSVELASNRAGLLTCGNLSVAIQMIERFPRGVSTEPEEQVAELMAYAVSQEYAELRRLIGVALTDVL